MDFDAVMGLDSGKAKARPKKKKSVGSTEKKAKSKGLLRSLRGSKKKEVAEEGKRRPASSGMVPASKPRREGSRGTSQSPLHSSQGVSRGTSDNEGSAKQAASKQEIRKVGIPADADPVLATGERIMTEMKEQLEPISAQWPTAALRKVLEKKGSLQAVQRTSECACSDVLKDIVAYAVNTRDSLARSNFDTEPDLNPYRTSAATKGSTKQIQKNKEVEKETLVRKRQLPTTMWTYVEGSKAKYFWKSIETKLKRDDVRSIRVMYQRAALGFALDQLRSFCHAAKQLGYEVGPKSRDVAHALLREDAGKYAKAIDDVKFVKSIAGLWQDQAVQNAFGEARLSPEQYQICTYMLDGIERILGPKYAPQSADFQYLQYLSREKLRMIRMNHDTSTFRFFGVDRVSGGTVAKWAPMAQDCVGMVVYLVDLETVETFNDSLDSLVDTLEWIRPNLAVLVFALGLQSLSKLAKSGAVDLKEAFPSYSGDKLEKFVKSRISRRAPSWFSGKFVVEFVSDPTTHDYYNRAVRLGNQVLVAQIHEVVYELTEAI